MHIHIDAEVEKFILSLDKQTIAKILRTIDLLEKFTFKLGMPHSKKISDDLFELRVRGKQEIRIFYCFYKSLIHLFSGFIKKSQTIPQKEMLKACNKYKTLTS